MTKKNTNRKVRLFTGLLAAVMALANMPICNVFAANAPALNIRNTTVQPEDMAETRNVGVELVISNNQEGFRAGSFGVHYDESLNFTNVEALTNAGKVFDIVCNPDENLIWFVGGSASENDAKSALQEESIVELYFDIAEDVNGGDFGLEFVWTGLDGSNAYWYADTQNNIIDTLSANSQNGKISFCNPDSEALNYTDLQLNPDAQEQLTVANASGEIFWFSSDAAIATVDENGVVTAISSGECQIQAFVNNHILACNVTVLDSYHYSVAENEEIVITSTETTFVLEYPDAAETVTWISANPDIVTVDSNGTLHAVKEGTANILATCNGKTYKKMITVSFATAARSVVLAGDVDENGSVDILDVIAMNKTILGQKVLTTSQQQAADLDKNGMVDTVDSLTLMKMIVGLI